MQREKLERKREDDFFKMSILHHSFKHKWFYHYRLHQHKLDFFCNNGFSSLAKYLNNLFKKCPDRYFEKGPRSSSLKFDLSAKLHEVPGHEVCSLAEEGLKMERYNTQHSKVQVFMLENDDKTISVEVPIWLKHQELDGFSKIFNTKDPLTGHIDILRFENNKIWVWDYKPSAEKEVYAPAQVFFYALMLSKRTNIPLNKFMCGYFDDNQAFIFKPSPRLLKNVI